MTECGRALPISTIYAKIVDNVVAYIVSAEEAYFNENRRRYPGTWVNCRIDNDELMPVGIGWTWDGEKFIPPPETEEFENEII